MEKQTIAEGIRAWHAASPAGDAHPALDLLAAYQEGRLDVVESDNIQEHLAHCPDCTRNLLDFAAFCDPETESAIPGEDVKREWQHFQNRIRPSDSSIPKRRGAPFIGRTAAYGLAAVLLLTTIGLVYRVVVLSQRLDRFSQPQLHDLVELVPVSLQLHRGGGEPKPVVFSTDSDRLLLWLNMAGDWEGGACRIAIFDAAGETVWEEKRDGSQSKSILVLELPRHFLQPGTYRIQFSGGGSGESEEYRLFLDE